MGKSFVEDDTSRAVETEFGREYGGMMLSSASGEYRLEVRKRIDMWNATVERVQSSTGEELSV